MYKLVSIGAICALLLIISTTGCFGCSEDITGPAYFELEEGAHLPCLGVKRLRVVVTDGQSEKVADNFGEYYDQEGRCNLPIYLTAAFDGLNTGTIMIRAEGFDSSDKRRISLGSLGPIGEAEANKGYLGIMAIDREPVNEGGMNRYPTGTVVISPLERIDEVENPDSVRFILNAGTPDSINGRFLTDPEVLLSDTEFVLSSVIPFDPPGSLIIATSYKNILIGQWKNNDEFNIEENDMFVEVTMAKEP